METIDGKSATNLPRWLTIEMDPESSPAEPWVRVAVSGDNAGYLLRVPLAKLKEAVLRLSPE